MIRHTQNFDHTFAKKRKLLRGFTMVELLVSVSIFLVLTGVVLANYRNFDSNAIFANASEDVVLALRQAQVYGAGTKGATNFCGLGVSSFECAYGVYFSTTEGNQIKIFIDVDDNKIYHSTGTDTTVLTTGWKSNIAITSLSCGGLPCTFGVMNVTFKRPNPDAYIADSSGEYDFGVVVLTDANTGKTATITITSAGQISIQ